MMGNGGRSVTGALAMCVLMIPAIASADWKTSEQTSQLDGKHNLTASLDSTNELPDAIGVPAKVSLIIRCTNGELASYVAWPDFMGIGALRVRWKADEWKAAASGVTTELWQGSGKATFASSPRDFARAIGLADKFIIGAAPYGKTEEEAEFDLAVASSVVLAVLAACPPGFSSYSDR